MNKHNCRICGFYIEELPWGENVRKNVENAFALMKDGTTLFNHFSTKTGAYTIDINKAGQVFKIRIVE